MKFILIFILAFPGLSSSSFAVDPTYLDTRSPLTDQGIVKYVNQVQEIYTAPQSLKAIDAAKLNQFLGRLCGAYLQEDLTKSAWESLRGKETFIVGAVLSELYSRVDPGVDVTRAIPSYYSPYERIASEKDRDNTEKKKLYERKVAAMEQEDAKLMSQLGVRRYLKESLAQGHYYLTKLYSTGDVRSQTTPTLTSSGLNQSQIDQLLGSNR